MLKLVCLQACCYHWGISLQWKPTLVFLPHTDLVNIVAQSCQVDGGKEVWEGGAKIKCSGFTSIPKTFRLKKTHPFSWWRSCCLCVKYRHSNYKIFMLNLVGFLVFLVFFPHQEKITFSLWNFFSFFNGTNFTFYSLLWSWSERVL